MSRSSPHAQAAHGSLPSDRVRRRPRMSSCRWTHRCYRYAYFEIPRPAIPLRPCNVLNFSSELIPHLRVKSTTPSLHASPGRLISHLSLCPFFVPFAAFERNVTFYKLLTDTMHLPDRRKSLRCDKLVASEREMPQLDASECSLSIVASAAESLIEHLCGV